MVERALASLEGFDGAVGIMGGEPTLHPDFAAICALLQKYFPLHRRALFTAGHGWKQYAALIRETFGREVYYNDHSGQGQNHQPVLVAIDEVLDDKTLMWELVDRCWVPERWSASITPKGGFFCEVAAAMDILFDGPGGFPVEPGWWRRTPGQCRDQMTRWCRRCSVALPLPEVSIRARDMISPGNLADLRRLGSPKAQDADGIMVFEDKITAAQIAAYRRRWLPWDYLGLDGKRSRRPLYDCLDLRNAADMSAHWRYKLMRLVRRAKALFFTAPVEPLRPVDKSTYVNHGERRKFY